MKRYLIAIVGVVIVIYALALVAPSAGAQASSSGAIGGFVVNASHHNAAVAGQKVILQRSTSSGTAQDIATTETGTDGHFSFNRVAGDANSRFAVYTQYQGGMFASQTVSLGNSAATPSLQLTVYDTTNDDANLRISVATLLVRQPRAVNGLIGIGEIITIENTSTTAFVGTVTGDDNKPMRLLRFATPPNASNLSLGIGFDGTQVVTTDKGFGATATVPPGTNDFAFSIDIPYTRTAADLSFKPVYPATRVVVLVPPTMFVAGSDFAAQGLINSLGSRYQVFAASSVPASKQASLRLTGLPTAGETSYLDARVLTLVAAILGLLALAALLLYLRRGDIAVALGLIPAQIQVREVSVLSQASLSDDIETSERQRLLTELLALERRHEAGELTDEAFRQRDQSLRQRLRELIASERSEAAPVNLAAKTAATMSAVTTRVQPASVDSERSDDAAREEAAPEQGGGGRR